MGRSHPRTVIDPEKAKLMARERGYVPQMGVPKQLQRVLPACVVALLFLYFMSGSGVSSIGARIWDKKSTHFPRKIWQTWKVDPMRFEERDHNVAQTWIEKNPTYRYEVLTDQNDLAYVETHFGPEGVNRPDIVFMYRELTARIIKADLLRYMIMYIEGGIYTDIDVEALKPADHFIPVRWQEKDVDMVVGVEVDQPEFMNHPLLGSKCASFCQWTFMCKPRLPVMLELIEKIMLWLRNVAMEQNKPISEIELDFDQVISGTGPSAFTDAILDYMSRKVGRQIKWDEFHDINESKLTGGVLVLTVEAFAAGQGHSDSGTHEGRQALVKHHYHASGWPTSHPRFNHPMYGEVERCNWVQDCVDQWDRDTADWEHLDDETKMRMLEEARIEAERIEAEAEEEARKLDEEARQQEDRRLEAERAEQAKHEAEQVASERAEAASQAQEAERAQAQLMANKQEDSSNSDSPTRPGLAQ